MAYISMLQTVSYNPLFSFVVLLIQLEEIYNFIERRISEEKQAKRAPAGTVIQQATSPAEELKKMKELLDMGIITQEEFDAKKKQLLGL